MRYFVAFSYFGQAYHGWQRQPNASTVQQLMEESLSTLLKSPISLVGAGRTDAGVHAKKMYAHFDFHEINSLTDLTYRLNGFLPEDIAIQKINVVPEDAHARFDAVERTYEYWIALEKNPFYKDTAHFIKHRLDIPAMNKAAGILLEHHDFECFSKSNTDVKTNLCKIKSATWSLIGDKLVFTITADRFLRNMVRAIVGTLLDVGLGKSSSEDVKTIIKSKDRSAAGASVPAKGLYLTKVLYPSTILEFNG
ncbi:tRNA pseudouridine(38-40) synthase TruA [uncultured Eudoraea sp.]|uniref:tRNA pseudouridine(38-40) synthase TruA n=1 Tax=uncultured Eudoraea sp. TaxID=1035614 RepID=UPI00261DDE8D|nr:tRNA pseudouridine(38-40) synthase TruA [uncultured Eudoraea sp.]